MLKLDRFDPRKRPRRETPAETRRPPGAHDDFKPTQPAVLSLEAPACGATPRPPLVRVRAVTR